MFKRFHKSPRNKECLSRDPGQCLPSVKGIKQINVDMGKHRRTKLGGKLRERPARPSGAPKEERAGRPSGVTVRAGQETPLINPQGFAECRWPRREGAAWEGSLQRPAFALSGTPEGLAWCRASFPLTLKSLSGGEFQTGTLPCCPPPNIPLQSQAVWEVAGQPDPKGPLRVSTPWGKGTANIFF